MSKYFINGDTLTGIADALRTMANTEELIQPEEMADFIVENLVNTSSLSSFSTVLVPRTSVSTTTSTLARRVDIDFSVSEKPQTCLVVGATVKTIGHYTIKHTSTNLAVTTLASVSPSSPPKTVIPNGCTIQVLYNYSHLYVSKVTIPANTTANINITFNALPRPITSTFSVNSMSTTRYMVPPDYCHWCVIGANATFSIDTLDT